jgi:SOS-response transcriptional repressor LexA
MKNLEKSVSQNEIKERFLEVIDTLKTKKKVAYNVISEKMGYNEQYFSKLKTKLPINVLHIAKLKEAFPEVNENYISKNQGNIFIDEQNSENSDSLALTKLTNKTLAIYDLDVQSGEISLIDDVSRDPKSTISFLGAEDCDFAVKVHGDSMTGKISNGAVVAVKELFDKDIIPYGHIFLIFTSDLRMVRYIKKSKKGDDYVKLSSQNNQFEDFEIKREKIIRLFMVKKILNDES